MGVWSCGFMHVYAHFCVCAMYGWMSVHGSAVV